LPVGDHPTPGALPHFPDRLHAVIWRNWELAPVERLAKVLRATPEQVEEIARSMGLPEAQPISPEVWQRSYICIFSPLFSNFTPKHRDFQNLGHFLRETVFLECENRMQINISITLKLAYHLLLHKGNPFST